MERDAVGVGGGKEKWKLLVFVKLVITQCILNKMVSSYISQYLIHTYIICLLNLGDRKRGVARN